MSVVTEEKPIKQSYKYVGTNVFIGLLYRFFFSNNTHNLAPFIGFCFISLAATRMAFTILS